MRIDVQYNQTPQRELTFWEKWQIMELLSQYPALTLKVLLHRRVGLRRAEPTHVLLMALLLLVIAWNAHNAPLALFALAVAIAGCLHHVMRWKEMRDEKKSMPWHTFSEGVSPIEDWIVARHAASQEETPTATSIALPADAPLPTEAAPKTIRDAATRAGRQAKAKASAMLKDAKSPSGLARLLGESRIYRRVEPTAVSMLGFVLFVVGMITLAFGSSFFQAVRNGSNAWEAFSNQGQSLIEIWNTAPLGIWLMFSASCLAMSENLKWRHQIRAYLDWYDAQIDAATTREWGGKKGRARTQTVASRRQSYGLATGIGTDLRACVEKQAEGLEQPRRQGQEQRSQPGSQTKPSEDVLKAPNNLSLSREPEMQHEEAI